MSVQSWALDISPIHTKNIPILLCESLLEGSASQLAKFVNIAADHRYRRGNGDGIQAKESSVRHSGHRACLVCCYERDRVWFFGMLYTIIGLNVDPIDLLRTRPEY